MGTDNNFPIHVQQNKMQPNYLTIAHKIEKNILCGKLTAGQKLGSIRQLAKSESVSINTIRAALDILIQNNRIRSVARIGFIVNPSESVESNTLFEKFTPDSRLAETSQKWLNTMVLGNRTSHPFFHMAVPTDTKIFKSFQRQYRQVIGQNIHRETDNAKGLKSLRQVISQQLYQRHCQINPNDIQITNGCQHAIEHALRVLCKPGDTIAIPVPAFPGYFALLGVLGLKAVEVPMSPSGPDPIILEQVMADDKIKAVLIQPNCHNPTGISLSEEYKKSIAYWAEQYKTPVIEDDISAQLVFNTPTANLIVSYDQQGWCLVVSSISKVIGDSERIGWCCPGRFKNEYMTQFAVSQISSSYFLQHTLARYYQGSVYPTQLRQWRLDIKVATSAIKRRLQQALGNTISVTQSTGGYALWLKLPPQITAQALHKRLDLKKIDFLCGELFSLETRFKHFLRLIVMPPLQEQTLTGVDHLIEIIKNCLQTKNN